MVMRNIKLCRACKHLSSQHGEIRSSIYYDYPKYPPIRVISLACDHWLNEALDDIERELDG